MIVSFHPCIEADRNITCAGRSPDGEDLKVIQAADAVILPQGCSQTLYGMAQSHCGHVFPNYDVRFAYPGKIGQIELFQKTGAPHPKTETFQDVQACLQGDGGKEYRGSFDYPFVFKFPWGGEGESVHLIHSVEEFDRMLGKAVEYERGGHKGFLLQEFIPAAGKTLRVVVVGQAMVSYWRIQDTKESFYSSLAKGAVVDAVSDSTGRKAGEKAISKFCCETGINLAGFDLIFSTSSQTDNDRQQPLFLEINYFFGRKGLGGSEKFYALLYSEVERWLAGLGLFLKT